MNRPGHLLQDEIGKRDILETRSFIALKLNGHPNTSYRTQLETEIFSAMPPPKRKNRPSRAEDRARDGNEFATAEHCTGIVLRQRSAVADSYVFRANKMEAIIVAIDAVVDIQAFHMHMLTLDDADAVIRSVHQGNIAHCKPIAAIEEQVIRTSITS